MRGDEYTKHYKLDLGNGRPPRARESSAGCALGDRRGCVVSAYAGGPRPAAYGRRCGRKSGSSRMGYVHHMGAHAFQAFSRTRQQRPQTTLINAARTAEWQVATLTHSNIHRRRPRGHLRSRRTLAFSITWVDGVDGWRMASNRRSGSSDFYRVQQNQLRQAQRDQRAAERAAAAAEREEKAKHLASRREEAERRTADVTRWAAMLDELLVEGLRRTAKIDMQRFKRTVPRMVFNPGHLASPAEPPDWRQFEPAAPGMLSTVFGGRERHQAAVARRASASTTRPYRGRTASVNASSDLCRHAQCSIPGWRRSGLTAPSITARSTPRLRRSASDAGRP